MLSTSPNNFPSPVDLPFNRASLNENLQLLTPDQDPGGDGIWLLLQGLSLLTVTTATGQQLPQGKLPAVKTDTTPIYIGQWHGKPCRILTIPDTTTLPPQFNPQPLRSTEPNLPIEIISLAGIGLMIQHWEQTSQHCGCCGTPMERLPHEWGKKCPSCSELHYPRIHPCVIGLIIKGDEVLLARKAEWLDGRYSLVAGFVEFGECLEEAMARETLEETGIKIKNIRYLGSQSWPFPSQLMCGFVADYAGGEIELRDKELEDAKWCKLDQMPTLPPMRSIARHIIERAEEFMQ